MLLTKVHLVQSLSTTENGFSAAMRQPQHYPAGPGRQLTSMPETFVTLKARTHVLFIMQRVEARDSVHTSWLWLAPEVPNAAPDALV